MKSAHVCGKCGGYAGRGDLCSTCASVIKIEQEKKAASDSVQSCLMAISQSRRGAKRALESAGLLSTMVKSRFADSEAIAVKLAAIAREGRGGGPYNAMVTLGAIEGMDSAFSRTIGELHRDGTLERISRQKKRRTSIIVTLTLVAAVVVMWFLLLYMF